MTADFLPPPQHHQELTGGVDGRYQDHALRTLCQIVPFQKKVLHRLMHVLESAIAIYLGQRAASKGERLWWLLGVPTPTPPQKQAGLACWGRQVPLLRQCLPPTALERKGRKFSLGQSHVDGNNISRSCLADLVDLFVEMAGDDGGEGGSEGGS